MRASGERGGEGCVACSGEHVLANARFAPIPGRNRDVRRLPIPNEQDGKPNIDG